jgi:hypothetical protein
MEKTLGDADALLPRHSHANGVLWLDQVIRVLCGVDDRELDAIVRAVKRIACGAKAMNSNSLLWRFFRWCE